MRAESEVESPYMTIQEAARYLHVSVHYLYRQVALGRAAEKPIPAVRFGRLVRFRREELDAWAKSARH